jgi:ethanolamine utilization protein EutA
VNEGVAAAAVEEEARPTFEELDNIELRTVGIDIGSSTSHLTFSEVHLQRLGDRLSSRYVPVERRIVHQSEIVLTPYLPDYTIDAAALGRFVQAAYAAAGVERHEIDSGAVILTGEATKRRNAAAISEELAAVAGEFVCATAGHRMEAIIAAHGSGAVDASRELSGRVLNVDVGGGTTKFALVDDGVIIESAAISVGGRLIASDKHAITRLEPWGEWFAARSGVDARLGESLDDHDAQRVAASMADAIVACILGQDIDPGLWLTPPLELREQPRALSFSGGVSQYIHGREARAFGDLGPQLGQQIRSRLDDAGLWPRVISPRQTIRATVIGASQYTVQVSGNTVSVSDGAVLPVRNVKVVPMPSLPDGPIDSEQLASQLRRVLDLSDLDPHDAVALAFSWGGRPFHERLLAVANAIRITSAADSDRPLIVIFDSDIARSVGDLLGKELQWPRPVVCLDGISVGEFDFVDVGARMAPSGAHPVVVKSLMFRGGGRAAPESR